jgi:hypothetical protein
MTSYGFHPAALVEYEDATRYYLEQASLIGGSELVDNVSSCELFGTILCAVFGIMTTLQVRGAR